MLEIWLNPMTKNPTHRKFQKATLQHKNATKNFDYTMIADRLRVTTPTQLLWLSRFTGSQPSQLPQKLCNQKDTQIQICK